MPTPAYKNPELRSFVEGLVAEILAEGDEKVDPSSLTYLHEKDEHNCYSVQVGRLVIIAHSLGDHESREYFRRREKNLHGNLSISPSHALRIFEKGTKEGIGYYILTFPDDDSKLYESD